MNIKLTDNEIIKALEDIIKHLDFTQIKSGENVLSNALDLINRQKEEIERLEGIKTTDWLVKGISKEQLQEEKIQALTEEINRLQAENERLKDALTDHEYANCVAIKNGLIYTHTLEDYDRLIGDIFAEAYKECIEKVKEHSNKMELVCSGALVRTDYTITEEKLDNLLKETVGEDK